MTFETYNEVLQKNIIYSHDYVGIIDFTQIHSEWTLHRMFLDKSDVALQAILSKDFLGKYKSIIFLSIELFFLCSLPKLHETKSLQFSVAEDKEYIFKFERELPIYAWDKMNNFINEICALNREEFKIRYKNALRNISGSLDGKMDIELTLLDLIRHHFIKIFTKQNIIDTDNCFVALVIVVNKSNIRVLSGCYNEYKN